MFHIPLWFLLLALFNSVASMVHMARWLKQKKKNEQLETRMNNMFTLAGVKEVNKMLPPKEGDE